MKLVSIWPYWRLCIPQRYNVWETILEYTGSNVLFTLICRVPESTYSLSRYAGARARSVTGRERNTFLQSTLLGKFRWLNRKFGFTSRDGVSKVTCLTLISNTHIYRARENSPNPSCFINSRAATVSQTTPFRLWIFRYYDSLKCRSGFPVIRVTWARGLWLSISGIYRAEADRSKV